MIHFAGARIWATMQLVLLLCALNSLGTEAVPVTPCLPSHRRLLQEPVPSTGQESADVPVLSTLEIGLVQQECIITFNSYLNPSVRQSYEVLAPEKNIQSQADNCCASCHSYDACNAWQWCPSPAGCMLPTFPFAKDNSTANSTMFPFHGCQLMFLDQFSPSIESVDSVRVRGPSIPFVAGTPFGIEVPRIDGYELELGSDLGGKFNYNCSYSEQPDVCLVVGNATVIADHCTRDSECMAFSYQPLGVPSLPMLEGPAGFLKRREEGIITANYTELNPTSAVYIKLSSLAQPWVTDIKEEEEDKMRVVLAATLGSVVGVMVAAVAVGAAWYYRRNRRLSRPVPESASPLGAELTTQQGSGDSGDLIIAGNRLEKKGDGRNSPPSVVDAAAAAHFNSQQPQQQQVVGANGATIVTAGLQPGMSPFMLLDQSAILAMMAAAPQTVDLDPSASFGGLSTGGHSGSGNSGSGYTMPGSTALHDPGSLTNMNDVVVTQVDAVEAVPPSTSLSSRGMPQGSTARELLDAFSRMYRQRPAVDYSQLTAALESAPLRKVADGDEEEQGDQGLTQALDAALATAAPSENVKPEEVEISRRPDGTWWQLGTGAYGTVYKGTFRSSLPVAVKVLHRLEDSRYAEDFTKETKLLKTLSHKHVVKFLGACLDGSNAMLVTELMELGDLWRALPLVGSGGERIFSWYQRGHRVILDVAKGLQYLHIKRIVHLDLKSANILLNRNGVAKIADVGMAKVLKESYLSLLSGGLGTFAWSAPEVLSNKRCDSKVDVYSFGIVLWEVCTGQAPVRGDMRPLQAPLDCPQEIVDLYLQCTMENPEERPSAAEVVEVLLAVEQGGNMPS